MTPWNELHYTRAQEFARLIADLTTTHVAPAAAPLSAKAIAPLPAKPAAPPAPVPPAAPTAPTPPAPPPASPTAGSIFNKIPWKK